MAGSNRGIFILLAVLASACFQISGKSVDAGYDGYAGTPSLPIPRYQDRDVVSTAAASRIRSLVQVDVFGRLVCQGTLLSAEAVLTNGHCCSFGIDTYTVSTFGDDDALPQQSLVAEIRQHEQFDEVTLANDICILILAGGGIEEVDGIIEHNVIADPDRTPEDGEVMIVAAWNASSSSFESIEVPAVPGEECSNYFPGFNDTVLTCVRYPDGVCQGSSGAPLLFADGQQLGFALYGDQCIFPGYPGLYVKATHFYSWIEEHLP